jgi:hypothetical protein
VEEVTSLTELKDYIISLGDREECKLGSGCSFAQYAGISSHVTSENTLPERYDRNLVSVKTSEGFLTLSREGIENSSGENLKLLEDIIYEFDETHDFLMPNELEIDF